MSNFTYIVTCWHNRSYNAQSRKTCRVEFASEDSDAYVPGTVLISSRNSSTAGPETQTSTLLSDNTTTITTSVHSQNIISELILPFSFHEGLPAIIGYYYAQCQLAILMTTTHNFVDLGLPT